MSSAYVNCTSGVRREVTCLGKNHHSECLACRTSMVSLKLSIILQAALTEGQPCPLSHLWPQEPHHHHTLENNSSIIIRRGRAETARVVPFCELLFQVWTLTQFWPLCNFELSWWYETCGTGTPKQGLPPWHYWHVGWDILCCGAFLMHRRIFSSIPRLNSLHVARNPYHSCENQKCLQIC